MKKFMYLIMAIVAVTSLLFMGIGCKTEAAPAEEEAMEEEAMEEEVVEEEAMEEEVVVADEEELYILIAINASLPVFERMHYSLLKAEKYWQSKGDNVVVELAGPSEANPDEYFAALETSAAKDPAGIIWMPSGIGEGPILQDYVDRGGMVYIFNGDADGYETVGKFATGEFAFGQDLGKYALDVQGEEFTYAIITRSEIKPQQDRMAGVRDAFKDYAGIEELGVIETTLTVDNATANVTSFLAANPDVDVLLGLNGFGAFACGTALREAGLNPGDKTVIAVDFDEAVGNLIEEGWVEGVLVTNWLTLGPFYAVSAMHMMRENAISVTNDDVAAGIIPNFPEYVTGGVVVNKDNAQFYLDYPKAADVK